MIFLKLIFPFTLNFCIVFCSICQTKEYFDDGICQKCIKDCEECTGSLPKDCKQCLPSFCVTKNGCEICDKNQQMKTMPSSKSEIYQSESDSNRQTNISDLTIYLLITVLAILSLIIFCCCSLILCYCVIKKVKFFQPLHKLIFSRNHSGIIKESMYDEEMPEKVFRKGFPSKVYEGNLLLNQREKIGHGAFGNVYKCPYVEDGMYILVAVKIAKIGNKEAAREREVLSQLSHLHIVELLSFNMKENLILIMPLRKDNLKNFMCQEKDRITNEHQIRYCMQISDAFRYISYKKLIHGDLKCSNILVENIKHVEVGDFGKCENMGNRRRTVGTITHTAMEILDKTLNRYSCEKTDVWSFGVTVWEIFNLCQKNPYDDEIKAANNKRRNLNEIMILDYLTKGQRLNPPQGMQPSLQSVMIDCWLQDVHQRPNFNTLFEEFLRALPECQGLQPPKKTADSNNHFFRELF